MLKAKHNTSHRKEAPHLRRAGENFIKPAAVLRVITQTYDMRAGTYIRKKLS